MTILLYAGSAKAIGLDQLGTEDYSYRFLLGSFRRMLEQNGSGRVVEITDPYTEADILFEACAARGEPCTLLSVTPPHRAPVGLACPTICIFAWEFSTIPNEPLDADPRSDWRYVFAAHGRTIALSRYTATVVRAEMGDRCAVAAIPAPLWDDWQPSRHGKGGRSDQRTIRFNGELRDTATRPEFGAQPVWPRASPALLQPAPVAELEAPEPPAPAPAIVESIAAPEPEPEPAPAAPVLHMGPPSPAPPLPRRRARERISLTRYYALEWYRATIRDLLPRPVAGAISACGRAGHGLYKIAVSSRIAAGATVTVTVTAQPELAPPPETMPAPEHPPEHLPEPQIDLTPAIRIERRAYRYDPQPNLNALRLHGIVYAAMLNPTCGRKNWYDIVTSFVWAFRDDPDATLVIKLIHADPAGFHPALDDILRRLAPFSCRVVTITGYLEPGQLADLIAATDFYVNASHAEGLCLPLMEFMSAGTPAIAPAHTAMADYISPDVAFIVKGTPEHNVWPHDPRDLFRTMRYRIEWDSLRDAFIESARVVRSDRTRYDAMASAASDTMRAFCSSSSVMQALRDFLGDSTFAAGSLTALPSRDERVFESDGVAS